MFSEVVSREGRRGAASYVCMACVVAALPSFLLPATLEEQEVNGRLRPLERCRGMLLT